jgi:hypothetical protein
MSLKAIYEKKEDIPEAFQELYTERDGKWEVTGIEGIKTVADVERVQEGARKERNDHKETKDKLRDWEKLGKLEDVQGKLDKYPELEAAASGKETDEDVIKQRVEARLEQHLAPVRRDLEKAQKENREKDEKIQEYAAGDLRRTIHDAIGKAARPADGAKVLDSALSDVKMVGESMFEVVDGKVITKDNIAGITAGAAPEDWLQEMQKTRPHWWPPSEGGGAGGSGGKGGFPNNPWSKEHWNLTQQGRVVREQGEEKAAAMAKAAGVQIGATRPAGEKK